jgi:hypothetical protein
MTDSLYAEEGTAVSGYSENGPYHCADCRHLTGVDLCEHPAVLADPALKARRTKDGLVRVNVERGCCAYVRQTKSLDKKEESKSFLSTIKK